MTRVTARTDDGWTLVGDAIDPPAEPRGVVVLAHAMMATRTTMDRPSGSGLGSVLAARGFRVLSFDLRGHGQSRPTPREGGAYRYDDFVLQDVPALVAHARASHPGLRVGWVGHSLGGHTTLVAAGLAADAAPDALVLLGANIWLPSLEPNRWRRLAKEATLRAWLATTKGGYFDPRRFRLGNEPVSRGFVEQFARFWREDRFASHDGRIDYSAAISKVRVPVLCVSSEADVLLANPVPVARFVAPVVHARVDRRVVRRRELGGWAPGHMGLVTDRRSRRIWDEVAAWLAARLSD